MAIRLRTSVLSALVLAGGMTEQLCAQRADTLLVQGMRVRVSVPSLHLTKQQGTLRALQGDTVVVALRQQGTWPALGALGEAVAVPLDSITRLEVFAGRKRETGRGAGIGFLAGAAVGLVVGPVLSECDPAGCDGFDPMPGDRLLGAVLFGGIGTAVGLGVGALVTSEQWAEVRVPEGGWGQWIATQLVPGRRSPDSVAPASIARATLGSDSGRVRVALREGPKCGRLGLGTGNPGMATVTAVSPNDITFRSIADSGKGPEWVVPWDSICRVEVSRGLHRNGWRGAAIGAIGGAVLGGVLGAAECTVGSGSGSEFCKVGAVPGAVYGIMIGAAIFVLPGAGIGALIQTERWEKVPPDALQVTVVPMLDTRRAGLALRLQF